MTDTLKTVWLKFILQSDTTFGRGDGVATLVGGLGAQPVHGRGDAVLTMANRPGDREV